jgi:hypothetical protein
MPKSLPFTSVPFGLCAIAIDVILDVDPRQIDTGNNKSID